MYSEMILNDDFFKESGTVKLENALDPLTKVLSRRYITDYCEYLIANNIPFSAQIIDLDNFKQINDNYGHQAGDTVLINFARRLQDVIGEKGYIGRFGGDEFMVVLPKITDYNEIHDFIANLYFGAGKPFRDKYRINTKEIYITGTLGSASFPKDATNYDAFFKVMDKALYRGKVKGRNCYIIYVESKHKDINPNELIKKPQSEIIYEIINIINDCEKDLGKELLALNDYFKKKMKISSLEYFKNNEVLGDNVDSLLNSKNYFFTNNADSIKKGYPTLYEYMQENKFISFLLMKVSNKYLMFTEKEIQRMWQDEHIVILMVLSRLLSFRK